MPSYKVVQSGHIVDIYKFQRSVGYDDRGEFKSKNGGRDKEGKEERKEEYKGQRAHKAYTQLMNIINANFNENSLFVTLTYKEHITDIALSNNNLKKFLQKMKRRQKDFKYVWVMEFTKKERIHYHMLCNYNVIWNDLKELQAHERILGSIWNHGFADIGYKKTDNSGAYLLKYMTKDNLDGRLQGKKAYSWGGLLEKPLTLTGGDAVEVIQKHEHLPPVYTSQYYSDFHGNVERRQYNPKRYDYDSFIKTQNKEYEKCLEKAIEIFGKEFVECI